MSWRATSWASEQVTGSPVTKSVLWKLADNANDEGICWPSVPLIAEHTELSERTVQQHLGRLEALGLIRIERRQQGGVSLPNVYHLAISPPARRKAKGGAGDSPPPQPAHGVVHQVHQGGESGGAPYKEEPPIEPSKEPLTNAPAGAGECRNVKSLGTEDLDRWPEFRSAIASTWPDGFPDENDAACKAEFGKLTRSHTADSLIECARLHGAHLMRKKVDRPRSAGALLFKKPSNWLRDSDWLGYLEAAQRNREAQAKVAIAMARVQQALGPGLVEILRNQLGISDAAMAALDGIAFEEGPPPVMVVPRGAAKIVLERHLFALQRKLGDGLTIQVVDRVKTA